jgi:AraC-like DNA-binding protein
MAALVAELAPSEGLHRTCLEGVMLRRSERRVPRTPVLYEPSVYIVASGRKRGYVGDRCLVYDANNYLLLSAPLPFECAVDATLSEPLLAVTVRMEVATISELVARMDRQLAPPPDALSCVYATPLDPALGDAVVRLLECLRSPGDTAILGPSLVREVTYRVLCGPHGETLCAMLGRRGHAARIRAVLRRIHAGYAERLTVVRLAAEAGMSASALHQHFKAVTASSPLQYLKAVRLHKARMLLVHDGLGAADTAYRVGYESPSQFSREFKRFFGHNPIDAARDARGTQHGGTSLRGAEVDATDA